MQRLVALVFIWLMTTGAAPTAPTDMRSVGVPVQLASRDLHPQAKDVGNRPSATIPKPETPSWTDVGILWVSAVQALVGGAGLIGLFFTVRYAKRAWEAANRSAEAADKTLEATRESEQRQLRAYVHLSEGYLEVTPGETRAVIKFRNYGLTPAYEVRLTRVACVRNYPLTEELAELIDDNSVSTLPPNGERHTVTFPFAEWDDPNGRWGQGGTALYVSGTFTYRDAFDQRRETHFRVYRRSSVGGGMSPSDQGNSAT